jgi:tryptophanyl-tRNA synthetase
MSLRDGVKKMSKSDPSEFSRINMTDDADTIAQKVRKATTDSNPLPDSVAGLEGRAEAANLLNIYAALTDQTLEQAIVNQAGQQFSQFKATLTETAVSVLGPINAEMKRLMDDPVEIDRVLKRGADKANGIAAPILDEIYKAVGFLPAAR